MEEPKPETSENNVPLPQAAETSDVTLSESSSAVSNDVPQAPVSSDTTAAEPTQPTEKAAKKPKLAIKKPNVKVKDPLHVILIVLLVIVAFIALTSYWQANNLNKAKKDLGQKVTTLQGQVNDLQEPAKYSSSQIKTGQIQAVFLAGGQVYFGNIIHLDSDTMTLQNIYYLKEGTFQKDGTVNGSLALVKLGNELHGPEDQMVIENKNVLFWENLKADSQVSKAIVQYKASH